MNSFWEKMLWGNTIRDWMIGISIIAISIFLLHLTKTIAMSQVRRWARKTNTTIDDFLITSIEKSVIPFFYLLAVYFGLSYLSIGQKAQNILRIALLVTATFFAIRLITSVINYLVESFTRSQKDAETKRKQARGVVVIVNIIIWIIGIVFLIDNLGYDITTLVAGLGIGGIAIALASQAILGDLFSYFVIFFDKPFEMAILLSSEIKWEPLNM
jgi:small-conductance mechanosensitive channel